MVAVGVGALIREGVAQDKQQVRGSPREEEMAVRQGVMQRLRTNRLIDHQEAARTAYVLYETAWADAWPHLDDWFKAEEFLSERGRNRSVIV